MVCGNSGKNSLAGRRGDANVIFAQNYLLSFFFLSDEFYSYRLPKPAGAGCGI